jgi:hypothetical protein
MCDMRATPQKTHWATTATRTKKQANRQPKKTVPGKALAEVKKQNRLSALGTPYPDGG